MTDMYNEPAKETDIEDAKSIEEQTAVADTSLSDQKIQRDVEIDEDVQTSTEEGIDYEALIVSDIAELRAEFPELRHIADITDLNNPLRYAALRDLGLTPREAYLATAKRGSQDTRSHLKSAHGRNAVTASGMMSHRELTIARELFPDMNDSQIQRLYKKVTK